MKHNLKKIIIIFLLLSSLSLSAAQAQDVAAGAVGQKPVMYSIFWNTLWGSAWGASMGMSYHLISGIAFRESIITGTTIGGMLGYGLGIYLVINGLSFDKAYLLELPTPKFGPQQPNAALLESDRTSLFATSYKPKPLKWEVPLYRFKF